MRCNRELFLSGFDAGSPLLLHVTSRVNGRLFLIDDEAKEMFVDLMRTYEEFCGVNVISHCILDNHFHLLVELPPAGEDIELSDAEFVDKLNIVYSESYVKEVKKLMRECNHNQAPKAMRKLKAKYTYRMGNISEFMKVLKQRFSRWYNKKHSRRGTLWEERYSATAVGAGTAARMVAAYIDLNPLRAGLVDDPKDYRWCSYGEAVAGGKEALAGCERLFRGVDRAGAKVEEMDDAGRLRRYRMLLAEEGEEATPGAENTPLQGERKSKRHKRRRGFTKAEIEEILAKGGQLSRAELLRCKVRYFTDGGVIGSKAFVNGFFQKVRDQWRGEREDGARKVRGAAKVEGIDLYSFRDLQQGNLG